MPFHNLANHICTFFLFLHNAFAVFFADECQEWGRRSRQLKEDGRPITSYVSLFRLQEGACTHHLLLADGVLELP